MTGGGAAPRAPGATASAGPGAASPRRQPARVAASAPGKLILCGEHAVVYRRPALVAAVDLRLRAELVTAAGEASPDAPVHLRVPTLDLDETTDWREVHAYATASRQRWQAWTEGLSGDAFAAVRSDDPGHLLKVALGEAARSLGEAGGPPLSVNVDSALPHGCGFGSSAAAAVTVVAAYLRLRGAAPEADRVEALALEAERRQHGAPSGIDGAAVLHGGVLWAERNASGRLVFAPFAGRSPLLARLAVFDTGRPAEGTGAVVAAVRRRAERQPARFAALWDEMEAATRDLRGLLASGADDAAAAAGYLRRCQRALEAIGVVPQPVRELVARIEDAGGAAKISGAGSLAGPGAGSLLVLHRDPEAAAALPAVAGLRRLAVALGGPGLRVEDG